MNNAFNLAPALLAGIILGTIFFSGLWWTVRKAVASGHAALWFLLSMLLRSAIVIFGFYLIMGDNWQKLLAGLLGFTIARLVVMRLTPPAKQPSALKGGAGHAP